MVWSIWYRVYIYIYGMEYMVSSIWYGVYDIEYMVESIWYRLYGIEYMNIRILENLISCLYWTLEAECEILVLTWSL